MCTKATTQEAITRNLKELYDLCGKVGRDLDLFKITVKETINGFDRVPIFIYGSRYGNDIMYSAKFVLPGNNLVGNICPHILSLNGVLRNIICRIKRCYNENIVAGRDIYISYKVYDDDLDVMPSDSRIEKHHIRHDTEIEDIVEDLEE